MSWRFIPLSAFGCTTACCIHNNAKEPLMCAATATCKRQRRGPAWLPSVHPACTRTVFLVSMKGVNRSLHSCSGEAWSVSVLCEGDSGQRPGKAGSGVWLCLHGGCAARWGMPLGLRTVTQSMKISLQQAIAFAGTIVPSPSPFSLINISRTFVFI
ncbi:hypothetical protein E2C01_044478 [Portunus trituberculatus]|uniref:Secreted protein n=1 Tax=Portunus trituberculatus TaxID=210409 RepID=A0A5B7G0K3_PORTR|nr:hypothetical protein [Portunus trituberculatus]